MVIVIIRLMWSLLVCPQSDHNKQLQLYAIIPFSSPSTFDQTNPDFSVEKNLKRPNSICNPQSVPTKWPGTELKSNQGQNDCECCPTTRVINFTNILLCTNRFMMLFWNKACSIKAGIKFGLCSLMKLGIILLVELNCTFYAICCVPSKLRFAQMCGWNWPQIATNTFASPIFLLSVAISSTPTIISSPLLVRQLK